MDSDAQDSIVALQALLNFKRSAQVVTKSHQNNNPPTSTNSEDKVITGVKVKKVPKRLTQKVAKQRKLSHSESSAQVAKIEHNSSSNAPLVTSSPFRLPHPNHKIPSLDGSQSQLIQSPVPSPLTTSLNYNPFALRNASESYQISTNSTIPVGTSASALSIENQISFLSSQQASHLPHAFSTPTAYMTLKQDGNNLPALKSNVAPLITANPLKKTNVAPPISHQQAESTTALTVEDNNVCSEKSSIIRAEEVEAALRSKPQRGKKRNNLSVLERMELTRTRNREHAKCTRARKKMRLEQLEANELKYFELQKRENLSNARRECVCNFLQLRSENLSRKKVAAPAPESTWQFSLGPLGNDSEVNDGESPATHRQSNASELSSDIPSGNEKSLANSESIKNTFQGIVNDFSSFKFVFQHGNTYSSQGLENLLVHEEKILDYMKRSHGNSDVCSIEYHVVGGSREVSLGSNNNGFALIEIVLTISREQKVTYSGFIEFQFVAGSHELIFFKHHEFLTKPCPDSESSTSSSLSQQVTFPSVVSLDVPSQGHVLSRLDINAYDSGTRSEKPPNMQDEVTHVRQENVHQMPGMSYQTEENQNPVGMDI